MRDVDLKPPLTTVSCTNDKPVALHLVDSAKGIILSRPG